MAIPSRQIGQSTQANLLWQISKQLERLICVAACGCGTTTTTTTTTENPLIFTDYTFFNCGPCGEFCPDPVQFNDVWMTSECINTWPSIGCGVWLNEAGTDPFPNGSYAGFNNECIEITDGVITSIIV